MKKRIVIRGTVEVPLAKGCVAFIRKVGEEPFRTSTVKHFITMSSGLTYIQTENTHYYLHPPTRVAAAKGDRV